MVWYLWKMVADLLKRLGYMFYLMNPSEHVYEKVEDVKDYYREIIPVMFILIVIEHFTLFWRKGFNQSHLICDLCNFSISHLGKMPIQCVILWFYTWIYTNFRIIDLPWNSPYTWIVGVFAGDFTWYWMHRAMHTISIFWAFHEIHHTPERLTIPSSFRNHIFHFLPFWILINPAAFVLPPAIYMVHYQLVVIYQSWMHTEQIGKLPDVIEYIFSTPSHHRVHHGRNPKYIDKNYGSVLIIWDRMFGTYEDEDPNDKPIFGTTTQIKSFNPIILQTNHFRVMWRKIREYEGIGNKLSVLFKGPGWSPGKPWRGNLEDIPSPPPKFEKIALRFPPMMRIYILVHCSLWLLFFIQVSWYIEFITKKTLIISSIYIVYSSIVFGFILDNSKYALPLEIVRCLMYFAVDAIAYPEVRKYFFLSIVSVPLSRISAALAIGIWTAAAIDSLFFGGIGRTAAISRWLKTEKGSKKR